MKIYTAELTIPVEQYGNIKPTIEGTAEDIVDAYFEFSRMVKPKEGIAPKEFNRCLDEYLKTGTVLDGVNLYEEMSPAQKSVFQEIKKSLKRIKAHSED